MRICSMALVWAFVLNLPTLQASQSSEEARPQIRLAVCDKVGLPSETLHAAKNSAMQVFATAGVDLIWLSSEGNRSPMTFLPNSFEGCGLPSGDIDFLAVISNESPKGWPWGGLGFSTPWPVAPQRVYILYDEVKKLLSSIRDTDAAILIGHVVAHEMGHLLLSDKRHTPSGIMSTGWRYSHIAEAAQGVLRFDPADAKRIRTELQARAARNGSRSAETAMVRSAR
jgi:hypothetical protein